MAIMAVAQRIEADDLYGQLHDLAYGTVAGQSYEAHVSQMDSDPVMEAAADLEDRQGRRSRSAGDARSMQMGLESALRSMRTIERQAREGLGQPKRGRPPVKWAS